LYNVDNLGYTPGVKMKKLMITVAAILISANSFADTQSSFQRGSAQLSKMGIAFRQHSKVVPKIDANDIMMGYAGQDAYARSGKILDV
jgi:hypothetical protein